MISWLQGEGGVRWEAEVVFIPAFLFRVFNTYIDYHPFMAV